MSKFDEKLATYKASVAELKLGISDDLLHKVAKGLGPSIYLPDAALVSSSDKAELDRVKNNFLVKKLGLKDSPALDAAVQKAVDAMGSSNRNKYRAVFYAILVKDLKQEAFYK